MKLTGKCRMVVVEDPLDGDDVGLNSISCEHVEMT